MVFDERKPYSSTPGMIITVAEDQIFIIITRTFKIRTISVVSFIA
jgi:hypothetical protein